MFNRRKAVIKHHVLHMKHTVFPRSTACFLVCRLDIPVLRSKLYHCIEHHNRYITCYQLKKKMIRFLLRSFPPFQIKHTYTLMLTSGFHHQRNRLQILFWEIFPCFKTLLHHFRHFLSGTGSIFQPMCGFVINCNAHQADCQQLIYWAKSLIHDALRNLFKCIFLSLKRFLVLLSLRSDQRGGKNFLIYLKHLFQVQTVLQHLPHIQEIIADQRNDQQDETEDDTNRLIRVGSFQLPAIPFQSLVFSLYLI